MPSFRIEPLKLNRASVASWSTISPQHQNWPVVYTLNGETEVYVGESLNAAARMRQHIAAGRSHLHAVRVILDRTFNKSVCLDLESFLIRMFAGDGMFQVTNLNEGITNSEYFDRMGYQQTFGEVFEQLRREGLFSRSIPQIVNTDLFKLSPFKALTTDQAGAVNDILEGLFQDLDSGDKNSIVIKGDPGTGKTIVAIYLMKLLSDIQHRGGHEVVDSDSIFAEYFVEGYSDLLKGFRVALVVPQQSLRESIRKVFAKTPGLTRDMVMSPFDVGLAAEQYDLLIVDETHRLSQRANQSSGIRNKQFADINKILFGNDDFTRTQLDWIRALSTHQIFLVDSAQSVRPADVSRERLSQLIDQARARGRIYQLVSQMRVAAGDQYVRFVRQLLTDQAIEPPDLGEYEFQLFENIESLSTKIREKNDAEGLSRMVAGFAWPWVSKLDKDAFDIKIEKSAFRWNSTDKDWINSRKSADEVGSIHTVQGYDLNYVGVIIGPELKFDSSLQQIVAVRENYHDKKGKENNPRLGITYTDRDLLNYIVNIYGVLMTRGMRGTYLYICDASLRQHVRRILTKR